MTQLPCDCVVGVRGQRCPEAERLHAAGLDAFAAWVTTDVDEPVAWQRYDDARERWWRHVTAQEEEGAMAKQTYQIKVALGWEKAEGEPLKIKGFEDVPIFIHQRHGEWVVSEGRQGSRVGCGETRAEAVRDARTRLSILGRATADNLLAYFAKRYGPPPADDGNAREEGKA